MPNTKPRAAVTAMAHPLGHQHGEDPGADRQQGDFGESPPGEIAL
ncbi:MAG TPA: hypothetical protein VE673_19630 [Pseudonocardiaceae bacterium]|nr:hypothetical protein [Pseudonocardiaceae bacterium]